MAPLDSDHVAASLERCIDELGERLKSLAGHSNATLAFALRTHLVALLELMVERGECTSDELRDFVDDLGRELVAGD